uniref:Uncharacterized protein n=1 Tax=Arundo donax TaxID=35708 RepID=A0A0A9H8D7_ARUDO
MLCDILSVNVLQPDIAIILSRCCRVDNDDGHENLQRVYNVSKA